LTETQTLPKCPECGSIRVFKDGFRKAPLNAISNEPIQRYRCADYGHRWSDHVVLNTVEDNKRNSQQKNLLQEIKLLAPTQKLKICAEMEKHSPTENEIKATPQIEKLITQLVNDGRKPYTIANYRKSFRLLLKGGADLFDPENTKAVLARAEIKDNTKALISYVLSKWYDFNGIIWRAPKYSNDSEIPYVPTEALLDQLISGLGKKTSVYCAILKDTGARPGEVSRITWGDIDFGQRKVRIKAEKHSNSRVLPLSAKTIDMLCQLPRKKELIFSNADDMRSNYSLQRRKLAKKIANPDIALICFKTFRHWKERQSNIKAKTLGM
jgi:integrase